MGDIVAMHGGVVNTPTPDQNCIEALRQMLEMAEAGEITGIVCARLHGNNLSSYAIAGRYGANSLLGALDLAAHDLRNMMMGLDQ